jgi:hypothetical protein
MSEKWCFLHLGVGLCEYPSNAQALEYILTPVPPCHDNHDKHSLLLVLFLLFNIHILFIFCYL